MLGSEKRDRGSKSSSNITITITLRRLLLANSRRSAMCNGIHSLYDEKHVCTYISACSARYAAIQSVRPFNQVTPSNSQGSVQSNARRQVLPSPSRDTASAKHGCDYAATTGPELLHTSSVNPEPYLIPKGSNVVLCWVAHGNP